MQRVKIVLKLFLLLLLTYFALRISFYFLYFNDAHITTAEKATIFYWGIRMDLAALFYINIPFLIYYFLLHPLLPAWRERVSLIIFTIINLFFIAINIVDLVYFRYNLRRSTVDIFYSFASSVHSFGTLFSQYWFVVLVFILLSVIVVYLSKKIIYSYKNTSREHQFAKWLVPVVFLGLFFFIARGADKRPIVPATALLHADAAWQPLVNNSTLNLLYSWLRATSKLERKNYFTSTQLDSVYTIRRQYNHEKSFEKRNVVVFILESFSADFLNNSPYKARTPFFDSLMSKSIVCENAFANGHESVMGLTAILGSLPPFTDEPLFISNYSAVPFNGIGTLLKNEGYNTSFFMGAEYDHFNFAKLCRMTGLDDYYSKNTYGNASNDDGNWGIYDGFFFPYFAKIIGEKKQPFLSVLFNLSSHPPFAVPASQKNQFTIPGQDAEQNSITYVDHCFSQLFSRIKDQPWFDNTVFVFCADHTLLENVSQRSYQYNAYHIPLFIYDPRDTGQRITRPVQQLDIVPTVLDKLNYSKPFMSFGNSFLRDGSAFAVCKKNDGYQLLDSIYLTGFDERSNKILYFYDYKADSSLTKNIYLSGDTTIEKRKLFLEAIIQRFNNSLLDQQLLISK